MPRPWPLACLLAAFAADPAAGRLLGISSYRLGRDVEPEVARLLWQGASDKRPLLTVRLVHGLGNQLFQVSALLSLTLEHEPAIAVELPREVGSHGGRNRTYWGSVMRKLAPLVGEGGGPARLAAGCQLEQVPHFDPFGHDCRAAGALQPGWADSLQARQARCRELELSGLFQRPAFFSARLPELRRLLRDEATVAEARRQLSKLGTGTSRDGSAASSSNVTATVSLHYRLRDYGPNGWVLDADFYDQALLAVRQRLPGRALACVVFSDEPARAWRRSESLDGCAERVLVPDSVPDDVSLYMMGMTEASVLADSTFSYFSAVLAPDGKRLVVAPRVEGPRADCWHYLSEGLPQVAGTKTPEWVSLPASTLSDGALLAEEVMEPADE